MQLGVTIALAIVFFVAFSIGLNLGLHGAISFGVENKVRKVTSNTDTSTFKVNDAKGNREEETIEVADAFPKESTLQSEVHFNTIQPSKPVEPDTEIKPEPFTMETVRDTPSIQSTISKILEQKRSGAISDFISKGRKLPILLLTCNRPELLQVTIESLLKTNGVERENIIVSQDGDMAEVSEIARQNNFQLIQHTYEEHLRGGAVFYGGQRIAMHYKYSISNAFDLVPDAPAIIIIEDDLLFSPDFYEYMHATAPILEMDPSTFVISAWNDNGSKGKVKDKYSLRRTEFFPGLGWLLPRALYKQELEARWPAEHWDHWLRSKPVHKDREIVYPQVPRTFHNGVKGTFMDTKTHNKYFRDIDYNTDGSLDWAHATPAPHLFVMKSVYELRVAETIKRCYHARTVQDIVEQQGIVCVWIDVAPEPAYQGAPQEFEPISIFFGLWHEHHRGAHKGLHEFYFGGSGVDSGTYILLLNVHGEAANTYSRLKPSNAVALDPTQFDKKLLLEMRRRQVGLEGTASSSMGMNCDQVCASKGKACRADLLPLLNTCKALNDVFSCRDCVTSLGPEQPAYVSPTAEKQFSPGSCLVSSQPEVSSCGASHPATLRLCACA